MAVSSVKFLPELQCFHCSSCGEDIEVPSKVFRNPESFETMRETIGRLHGHCASSKVVSTTCIGSTWNSRDTTASRTVGRSSKLPDLDYYDNLASTF